jgi:hypothetical protein
MCSEEILVKSNQNGEGEEGIIEIYIEAKKIITLQLT